MDSFKFVSIVGGYFYALYPTNEYICGLTTGLVRHLSQCDADLPTIEFGRPRYRDCVGILETSRFAKGMGDVVFISFGPRDREVILIYKERINSTRVRAACGAVLVVLVLSGSSGYQQRVHL